MAYSMNNDFMVNLIMPGTGYEVKTIPRNYQYLAIINGTANTIEIYANETTPDLKAGSQLVVTVPLFTMITVPIFSDTKYTFIYTDGGGSNPKTAQLIFSDKNLNINGQIGSAGVEGSVNLIADSVGLARQAQLPAALGGGGGVKVERVDVGRETGKATAAGDTTIKGSAGKVWALVCVTPAVTAKLKDGAAEKWAVTEALPGNFPVPIACGGSIVIELSGAGEAYVLYE